MAGETWAAEVSAIAKRLYPENKIKELTNQAAMTYGKLTTKKNLAGAGDYLPINTAANELGQGNISEDGHLQDGGTLSCGCFLSPNNFLACSEMYKYSTPSVFSCLKFTLVNSPSSLTSDQFKV